MTWTSRFKLWGGVLAVLLVTALLTLLFNQRQNSVNSFTATVDAPSSPVGSAYGGIVIDQLVDDGDQVTEGQQLFKVSSTSLQQAVSQGANPANNVAFDVDAAAGEITYKAVATGYLTELTGVRGAYIPDGQPLATIVSESARTVKAQYRLSASDYGRIEQGAAVTVIMPNMAKVSGQVESVTVKTDQGEALTEVIVSSDPLNDGQLGSLTRRGTPVIAQMHLRDDGPLAGPTQSVLSFLTKIGLR